ncbi:bifunctional metallophosphatase/5'-nucleotidase [Paenibacillus eucommiae]|uniref:2',3'-cyclic-nucleotide 2'-phosphodiesterase (5'-nucleotidase family) n=1 Tax=Paenibacillus eucommiae TaxID=1355755 RepID=A0ABS4J7U1_9BACL|nr:bifunctional UDP-sugar hydrolase/5'-nucleotidase [Paenibacillus eucommiae]MBP1995893.1 2',3'-cyclic-nucleotide 2'-phosphodiesterase (5'-nucleotidase family) [Paenibacillus eucommiae]
MLINTEVALVPDKLQRLVVLHTNDLHSHFEQMPKVAAYFNQVRERETLDCTLTLDIGDHMDRGRPETEGTGGIANLEIMNATGYEAMVFGNNEGLTFTPESLGETVREYASFPVIGSNLLDKKTEITPDFMVPYHIIHKSGLRIGLIGVTAAFAEYYHLLGWQVTDPLQAVAHYTGLLRPDVEVLIVLSHLGLRMDEQMANEIEGIDLILGAHTHHLLEEPLFLSGTYVCAAGKFGQYAGHIELAYDPAEGRIRELEGRVVDLAAQDNDSSVSALLQHYQASASAALDVEVTRLRQPLSIDWYGESPLGNLVAAGLRRWTSADIGLVNSGQLLQGLKEGRITRGQLLDICPGPINPCRFLLSGRDLLQALEESLLEEFRTKRIRGLGFRGEVLGAISLDGMHVEFDPAREPYHQIVSVRVGDSPLETNRDYLVGTIDMFAFGSGYLSLKLGKQVEYLLPEFLRDVLAAELQNEQSIHTSLTSRHWTMSS